MADEDKLDLVLEKIATAEGAFRATGYLGGAIIVLVACMAIYLADKVESHDKSIAVNTQDIAVLKSRKIHDHTLEKVRYKK